MIQSLKLCFNSEVHKVASVPKDFNSLLQNIQRVLKEDVPSLFTLQYEDEEGDKIIIATDDDYQLALKTELRSTSLKIYINDADEKNNISIISRSSVYELLQEEQANMDANVEQLKKEAMKSSTRKLPEVAPHHETITTQEEAESPIMILGTYKRVSAPITPQTTSLESPISIVGTYSLKKKSETKKLLKKEAKDLQDDLLVEIELEDLLKPKKKKVKKPVHSSIRCDDCGVSPIVGTRYQCSVIVNYDLCEECEAKGDHPYPLLKLRDESQIPSAMMALYGEDVESPSKKSKKSKKSSKKNKKSKASDEEELLTMLAGELEGMNYEDFLEFADAFDEEDSEEELAYPGQLVVNTQPVVKVAPQTTAEKKPTTITYPLDVTNKAQCVFEIFPHQDFHDVCRYIADSPTKTLQEIVLDYMVAY